MSIRVTQVIKSFPNQRIAITIDVEKNDKIGTGFFTFHVAIRSEYIHFPQLCKTLYEKEFNLKLLSLNYTSSGNYRLDTTDSEKDTEANTELRFIDRRKVISKHNNSPCAWHDVTVFYFFFDPVAMKGLVQFMYPNGDEGFGEAELTKKEFKL